MPYRINTTPDPGPPRRRTRSIIRWWTTPAGSRPDRRRLIRIALALAALSLAVAIASTSVWNYYGLSLPVPKPTGHLTASRPPVPGGSLDRPSGAIEWEFDARAPITASPTSAGGAIYVVSGATADTGSITSLSESAGSRLWQVRLRSIADYPPVVAGDTVYVGTRAGSLIALDRDTGETLWLADLESSVVGSPIVHDGAIYVASNAVHAIDAANGSRLWRHEVGGAVSRPVRLSNGIVAAIGSDGNVNLISAANGRRRLTFPIWFGTSAAPAVSGATLVIPGDRAFVQALGIDRRDVPMEKALRYWWTKLWLWDMAPRPPLPRAYLWQNRAIGGDTAYALGADDSAVYLGVSKNDGTGTVVALDLSTGRTQWEVPTTSAVTSPAIQTERSLIVGLDAAYAAPGGIERTALLAIHKHTGETLWTLPLDQAPSAAPTLTDTGLLLFPTTHGVLKAIR